MTMVIRQLNRLLQDYIRLLLDRVYEERKKVKATGSLITSQ